MNIFPDSRSRPGLLERNLAGLAETLEHAASADVSAGRDGLLQRLDPRAKILGLGSWIVTAVSVRSLATIVGIGLAGWTLAAVSRIALRYFVGRVWFGVLLFTGIIALPAVFLTPGPSVGTVPGLDWPVTAPGLRAGLLLLVRAETAATLALTLVFSTPWTRVLKALRILGVPTVLVVILGITYRYLFLLLRTATDFFTARRSRQVGRLSGAQRRQAVAGTAGVLLDKSLALSEEVYQAMQSRGFRGEVYTLDDFRWQRRDTAALAGFFAFATLALWLGFP